MDTLVNKQTVSITQCALDYHEESVVSGDFTLPDYCRDIAVVLKCMMTPSVQQCQINGDQLVVDMLTAIRVLYLDEDRRAPYSVEFAIPTSCIIPMQVPIDKQSIELDLEEKYVNCRAVGPRRVEVRGAVTVSAKAMAAMDCDLVAVKPESELQTRRTTVDFAYPVACVEKALTLHECLDFPETMPPADMLLGGECRAVINECKLLAGKGIVKGHIYVHQLYLTGADGGECHCLDFVLPFSQIVDVPGAEEGMPYRVNVQIISDAERCAMGPRGENAAFDITVKLSVHLQVFRCDCTEVVLDAYHTAYPVTITKEEKQFTSCVGGHVVEATLPLKMPLPIQRLSKILDVWVQPQGCDVDCSQGSANLNGHLCVCILARDEDGQVVYIEHPEKYHMDAACTGNCAKAKVTVTELRYRAIEDQLEVRIGISILLNEEQRKSLNVVKQIVARDDQSYPHQKAGIIAYYAQAGEDVWDIAMRCHTAPESICEENNLSDNILRQSSMLLIPIVS